MHFSKLFMTAMVGAASAAPAVIQQRDMSANDVVGAIGEITVLSASLNLTVSKIEFSPLAIINPSTFTVCDCPSSMLRTGLTLQRRSPLVSKVSSPLYQMTSQLLEKTRKSLSCGKP
jgi:hypothetical protein